MFRFHYPLSHFFWRIYSIFPTKNIVLQLVMFIDNTPRTKLFANSPILVLATGPGNPPAVWVWPAKMGRFGSRTVQKSDPLSLGGPNPDPYPSTGGFCRDWLDPLVPMSGSAFWVFLFMVAFRYPTVSCKILTLGYH